jgi:dephospho-CoA kinase
MLVVGLTGGIGSGKTEVGHRFAELGVPVIDTDMISRDLAAKGSGALSEIAAAFGSGVLRENGELDRHRLRERVFANEDDRRMLEDILHPRIRDEVAARLNRLDAPYAVVVIPLLLETRYPIPVDRVLVVDVPEPTRIERVTRRDGSTEDAVRRIMVRQAGRAARLAAADDVMANDGDLALLDRQVQALHQHYLQLAIARH